MDTHEFEMSVLGSLLVSPDKWDDVVDILDDSCFAGEAARMTWECIRNMAVSGDPFDVLLLKAQLESNRPYASEGISWTRWLSELTESVPTGVHAEHYARILKDKANRRRLMAISDSAAQDAHNQDIASETVIERIEASLEELLCSHGYQDSCKSAKDLLGVKIAFIEDMLAEGRKAMGLTTGFHDLDDVLTGLHGGDFVVIGGRPSMGKSTLAMNMARRIALSGHAALFFSLEMSGGSIINNLLAAQARVDGQRIRKVTLNQDDMGRIFNACDKIQEMKLYVVDKGGINLSDLCRIARSSKRKHGIDIIFVDYMQLVTMQDVRGKSREQQVAEISRGLKALAKNLDIPVVAMAQLSRAVTQRSDPKPVLSDLRESGAIEQDADVIMFIHRPGYYGDESRAGQSELIVAKQRNGPLDTITLTFVGSQFRFEQCDPYTKRWEDEN